jgi:hypothetical protein
MADPVGSVLGTMDSGAARLMRSARAAGSAARVIRAAAGLSGKPAGAGVPVLDSCRAALSTRLEARRFCGSSANISKCLVLGPRGGAKILVEHAGGSGVALGWENAELSPAVIPGKPRFSDVPLRWCCAGPGCN